MICEGSWDTEDWSIDAENSALDLSKKNKIFLYMFFFVYNLSIYVSYKPTF